MLRRTRAVAKKEIKQLMRDVRLLFVIFFFPALLLIVFGYAVNFDVKKIKIAVYDNEKSEISREYVNSLLSSEYFKFAGYIERDEQIKTYLDDKIAQCIAVIPKDLSRKLNSRRDVKIQYLVDGVNSNTASIIKNYVNLATFNYSQKILNEVFAVQGIKNYAPISFSPRFWFNPELQTSKFLIPGLIAVILLVTSVITVALSLVREKERGTIEQLNVSPITSGELIVGKTIPYLFIALINAALILTAGYILFDIVVKGSMLLLFFTTLLFLMASTSLGLFVSVISNSQQVGFTLATFISLLPSVILSGFIFPIESMPVIIQVFTNITPAKFFIQILRAIIIRGVGLEAFWDQLIYLSIFTAVLLLFATIINKRKTTAA